MHMGSLHIWENTIHAEQYIHTEKFFFMEILAYFIKTVSKCFLHVLQQHGLLVEKSEC